MKNVEDIYPLSPLQESLLSHVLAAPGSGVGFEQKSFSLRGDLNAPVFLATWQRLVDRHPVLRTAFLSEAAGEPLQVVRRQVTLPVESLDWSGLAAAEQQERIRAYLQADRRRGFDVRRAPLMRLALARLSADLHQFIWSYHHLVLDAWCRSLLLREALELYEALCRGEEPPTVQSRPYRDYIAWLRRQDPAAAETFWCGYLAGISGPTPFAVDRLSRPDYGAERSSEMRQERLPAPTTAALEDFGRRRKLTLNTLIQGAWALLLSRYSGEEEVIFGTTVSGRPAELPGVETMKGMFINNLPVRVRVPEEGGLVPWLAGMQQNLMQVGRFAHSSPAQIQEWSGLPGGRRLFESLVLFQNTPSIEDVGARLSSHNLSVETYSFRLETAYPITLMASRDGELPIWLYFDSGRFEAATILRMLGHLRSLLRGFFLDPDRPLASLDLLTEAERQQLVIENGDSGVVLDRGSRPVPYGVVGELRSGGAHGKTQLARRLSDGSLELLGPPGRGLWVRGQRIEPGDMEALLRRHPAVAAAAVVARHSPAGELRLVGYVAARPGASPAGVELRAFLRGWFPDFVLPTVWGALPPGWDGTLDPEALPDPGIEDPVAEGGAAGHPVEEIVAKLWAELLQVDRVGRDDQLFDLGAHSLLAVRLISRIRSVLGVELSIASLFEDPTVAGIAAHVDAALRSGPGLAAPPLAPVPRDTEPLPLSFAQERLWFVHQLEPASDAFNIPRAVRLTGRLDVPALGRVLGEIARRHELLRTAFPKADGRPSLVVEPAGHVPLPVVDLAGLPPPARELEARRVASEEARRPFDLARAPLFRTCLLRLDRTEHAALFTLHHIISDAWSMGVLVGEVAVLYAAFAERRPSPLPELPIQYGDFAHWQRLWLTGEILERQLAYWVRRLSGAPELLALPTDRPRPETQTFRGAFLSAPLPPELAEGIETLSRRHGTTLFMTLLAAFTVLLHHYTGQEDLVVGTDVAGRNRLELEGLIGFFINNLALRLDLAGNPAFSELLRRVRETSLEAYAHQDLPFDRLVTELKPRRTLRHVPLFQVLFVLQNAPAPDVELPDLRLSPMAFDFGMSKFDLGLFITTAGGVLTAHWHYSTDLFERSTIDRMSRRFVRLLTSVCQEPEARLNRLEALLDMENTERKESAVKHLSGLRRRSGDRPPAGLIETGHLDASQRLPLLMRPKDPDLDPAGWAEGHRELIERELLKHGAILFRDFGISSAGDFERFASAICPDLFGEYGDLPREEEGGRIYHSTPYPPDKTILFHNESSHLHRWPMKQWFYCVTAARQGGETPIVDCRAIYRALDPQVVQRFERRQVMYVRTFIPGFDVSWQEFFKTEDRSEVEEICQRASIECDWKGGRLQTRKICPAVARHPKTEECIFFNQIQLHHVACLDPETRQSMLSVFRADELPRNVLYGDGSPIEEAVMRDVTDAYWRHAVAFPWREGDVLMVDNMLVAHARNPHVGPRKIVVAMGELHSGRMD